MKVEVKKREETGSKVDTINQIYDLLTQTSHTLNRYEDDPDSIQVEGALAIEFNQYIGETTAIKGMPPFASPINQLISALGNNNRVLLKSNAGTGKSYMVTKLAEGLREGSREEIEIKDIGVNRIIVLAPTTSITRQLGFELKSKLKRAEFIDGASTARDITSATHAHCVVCCYDSLSKIEHLITPSTLVVVDEFHTLVSDYNFRDKDKFNYCLEAIQDSRQLFISATPCLFFALDTGHSSYFGFKTVIGKAKHEQKIELSISEYKGRQKDIPAYALNKFRNKGMIACKFDSKKNLGDIKKAAALSGRPCDVFTSSNKEGSKNYKSLMKTGFVEEGLEALFFTTLLEAGVSIKNEVDSFVLIGTTEWSRVIQLFSRARYNKESEVNKHVRVELMRKGGQERKEDAKRPPIVQRFHQLKTEANIISKTKNEGDAGEFKERLKVDVDGEMFATVDKKGVEVVNVLWILHQLNEESNKVSIDLQIKRICRYDSRVKFTGVSSIDIATSEALETVRARRASLEEQEAGRLQDLLKSNTIDLLRIYYKSLKDLSLKHPVALAFGEQVTEASTRSVETLKHGLDVSSLKPIGDKLRALVFLRGHHSTRTATLDEVVELVCKETKDGVRTLIEDLKTEDRRFFGKHSKKDLSKNDRFAYDKELVIKNGLRSTLKNISRGKAKDWRTGTEWQKTLNKIVAKEGGKYKAFTKSKAIEVIKSIYITESRRATVKAKKVTLLKIGSIKTRDGLLNLQNK